MSPQPPVIRISLRCIAGNWRFSNFMPFYKGQYVLNSQFRCSQKIQFLNPFIHVLVPFSIINTAKARSSAPETRQNNPCTSTRVRILCDDFMSHCFIGGQYTFFHLSSKPSSLKRRILQCGQNQKSLEPGIQVQIELVTNNMTSLPFSFIFSCENFSSNLSNSKEVETIAPKLNPS